MTRTRPVVLERRADRRARRMLVEGAVGVLLVLAALVSMVAGGSFSVAAADASRVRPSAAAAPALILQCPLGVHRVPLGSSPRK